MHPKNNIEKVYVAKINGILTGEQIMRRRFLKAKHWLLIALLGLMGLTSCGKDDESDSPYLMYGVPEKTYTPGE